MIPLMVLSTYFAVGIVYMLGERDNDDIDEILVLTVMWPCALMQFPHGFTKFWRKYCQMNFFPWRTHANRQDSESVESRIRASIAAAVASSAEGASTAADGGAARASVEIVAWRAWTLAGGVLWSTSHPCRWEGPVFRADVVPKRDNSNGIYAVKALENAPYTSVWGEVALSGIVVEGEDGYRAEVATIRSLFVGRRHEQIAPDGYHAGYTFEEWPDAALCKTLEERYKVDVCVVEPRLQERDAYTMTMTQQQLNASAVAQGIAWQAQPVYISGTTQFGGGILGGPGIGASGF